MCYGNDLISRTYDCTMYNANKWYFYRIKLETRAIKKGKYYFILSDR